MFHYIQTYENNTKYVTRYVSLQTKITVDLNL